MWWKIELLRGKETVVELILDDPRSILYGL